MRNILLAYRDFDSEPDWEARHPTILQPDGTPAFLVETSLTVLGIVGIEDPLRPEVPRLGSAGSNSRPASAGFAKLMTNQLMPGLV